MSNRTIRFFIFGMAVTLVTSCFAYKTVIYQHYEGPRLLPEKIAILTYSRFNFGGFIQAIDGVENPGFTKSKYITVEPIFEVLPGEHQLSVGYHSGIEVSLVPTVIAFHAEAGKVYELFVITKGSNWTPFVIEATSKSKGKAAEELKEIGDTRTVEPLLAFLKNRNSYIRWGAAKALVNMGPPVVEPLIAFLKNKSSNVRSHVAWVLGKMNDARAGEPLIAALNDEDADVRNFAAAALGEMKEARAVGRLIAALVDEDTDTRRSAAWALGEIRDPRAEKPLTSALRDKEAIVRNTAAFSLDKLKEQR